MSRDPVITECPQVLPTETLRVEFVLQEWPK